MLRIIAISLITWFHALSFLHPNDILPEIQNIIFLDRTFLFGRYPTHLGFFSAYLLIFISGAVLEYNHPIIEGLKEYQNFVYNRFIRLYPAYWISLIVGFFIIPQFILLPPLNLFLQITGLITFTQRDFGCVGCNIINPMVWFVVAIFLLYLLYPLLSKLMSKHPFLWLIIFFIIDFASFQFIVNSDALSWYPGFALGRVFPLCNIFAFTLGMFVIRQHYYPKNKQNHLLIAKISDYTFYVFLCQFIFYKVYIDQMKQMFPKLGDNIFFIVGFVLFVSMLMMLTDKYFQTIIKKRNGSINGG